MTAVAVLVGVLAMAFSLMIAIAAYHYLTFDGECPFWMPFPVFQGFCRIGTQTPVLHHQAYFAELFDYAFRDDRYNHWRSVIIQRGAMTCHEWMALDFKMCDEQEREGDKGLRVEQRED